VESPRASVIVSSFDRPANLERCLEGFRAQSVAGFEVLVADDGSGQETRAVIERADAAYPVPLHHVWHPDEGFRKCAILNRAVRQARAEYVIFTDADCVPHRCFVENHLRHRRAGHFLVGRSVKWGRRRSRQIDLPAIRSGRHAHIGVRDLWESLRGDTRHLPQGLYLPGELGHQLGRRLKKNLSARGGNLSVWKHDLMRVNGWNEDFASWGLEDVELGLRLRLAGLIPLSISHRALTFHLHHPAGDRASRSARRAYDASKQRRMPWCPNGLVKDGRTSPGDLRQAATGR